MVRRGRLALLIGLSGCAGATRSPESDVRMVMEQAPDETLVDLIEAALGADARLEPATPLYTATATVLANGEARPLPPRYAGLAPGGEVEISNTRIEVREGMAWALVAYRWVSRAEGMAREAVATFVLLPAEQGGVGWRIHHAHSSSPPGL